MIMSFNARFLVKNKLNNGSIGDFFQPITISGSFSVRAYRVKWNLILLVHKIP